MTQYQTATGIPLRLVCRREERIPYPELSDRYGDPSQIDARKEIARSGGRLAFEMIFDVCYLSSACGKYQVRCQAKELHRFQGKVAA